MRIFRRVVINTKKYRIKRFYLFNIPLFQYIKVRRHKKKYKIYSFIKKNRPKKNQRVFYLKVHRVHKMSMDCIKHWINIVNAMGGFIYFVCDNPIMEKNILNNVQFLYKNFEFIKSDRKTIKKEIAIILHKVERFKLWRRIAYSMLTPFIHAAKHDYTISYNIDADDILICSKPEDVAKVFEKAEKFAIENNLDLFNLDMFYSKSFGVHWSFGVVLCLNPKKCLNSICQNLNWRKNKELIDKYNICWIDKFNFNVDWLFTYFRDTKQLNIKTFYIDKGLVIHMPDIILEHGWAFMIQWENNEIKFPILSNLYDRKVWDKIQIPKDAIKIDIGLQIDNYKNFFDNFYDFGVGFEMDMLDYAKSRNLISQEQYNNYAITSQFIRESEWRRKLKEERVKRNK